MSKAFIILFSLYILTLSVWTCSDSDNECMKDADKTELASTHTHHNDSDDTCSPFCTCTCCGQIITINYFSSAIKNITTYSTSVKMQVYTESFISLYEGKIWQPPKLSV
ncbi:MAG: hypothetical protein H7321_08220 [Bacteroidia bacterium]|nr:hypothetical protein [Bacteroidia bacterium]